MLAKLRAVPNVALLDEAIARNTELDVIAEIAVTNDAGLVRGFHCSTPLWN
jgi:hypothetical protein